MKKIFSIDVDGVLNDYPLCWLNYVKNETGFEYKSTQEAKIKLGIEAYQKIKSSYRKSDYKENIKFSEDGRTAIYDLLDMGFDIIAATSRPLINTEFPDLKGLTERWLEKNLGFPMKVVHKNESVDFINNNQNIKYHIDDELKYAVPISNKNIHVFLIDKNNRGISEKSGITKVTNFSEVISILKKNG